ncbi:MAG: RDD family protein [Halofilum sp. (in: g-proteobacteria)]|nr:RDD family protein [Halofilum sp. (in: g-proteobacteria)]
MPAIHQLLPALVLVVGWARYGATPGKVLLELRVVDAATGGRPSPAQALIRLLGYLVSALPLGLGFAWAAVDRDKQALHDKLARTRVVVVAEEILPGVAARSARARWRRRSTRRWTPRSRSIRIARAHRAPRRRHPRRRRHRPGPVAVRAPRRRWPAAGRGDAGRAGGAHRRPARLARAPGHARRHARALQRGPAGRRRRHRGQGLQAPARYARSRLGGSPRRARGRHRRARVRRAAHGLAAWLRRAGAGRRDDLRAWLVDEIEALPARAEVDEWLAAIDRLRVDADRLAARLARLERGRGDDGR